MEIISIILIGFIAGREIRAVTPSNQFMAWYRIDAGVGFTASVFRAIVVLCAHKLTVRQH
jgi:hypothetical protein